MARKCPDWLETFMAWNMPRSEAPESYIYWTGLFTLSCVLRRKVKIPKSILGSWECPPHLYVMFIGPPGGPKKTTTMSYAIDLLAELPDIKAGPTIVTQAALLSTLVESEDSSVYVIAEEFSDLIMKSKGEMFEFLTSMFDGKKKIEGSTIGRGVEFAEKPCVNMLAGTTPVWVSENMSEAVIGGGFASRVIFLYEEESRRKQLIYKGSIKYQDLDELQKMLTDDLKQIDTLEGDFDITDAAIEWLDNPVAKTGWYQTRSKEPNKKLQGFWNREPAHLLKLAMLLQISKSDELLIDVPVLNEATKVLEIIKKKLHKVFEGVGRNPYTFDMRHIIEYVVEQGRVEPTELKRHFTSVAPPSILDELINALLSMKLIKAVKGDDNKLYYVAEKK